MHSNGTLGWRRMMDEETRVPYDARVARAGAPEDGKVMSTHVELGNADRATRKQRGECTP